MDDLTLLDAPELTSQAPANETTSRELGDALLAAPSVTSTSQASTSQPSSSQATANPPAPAPVARQSRQYLVTTRIGVLFFCAATSALVCALSAHALAQSPGFGGVMWVVTVAVCSLCGMVSMRSVRTLQTIESELRRCTGTPGRWRSVRPIIGTDRVTEGWNELLKEAARSHQVQTPKRAAASLDQEVVTLARAMRQLPVAWVVTDREGRIRFISASACGLFGITEENNHVGRDLTALLGLRNKDDETAKPTLTRLLSDLRMVQERRTLTIEDRPVNLRIRRSILSGRSSDGEGLAWTLTDITQQEIASKARDQFLMTATHELRTPLTNLQAYAEALQEEDGLEVERQKEFCNIIVSEANRLGRLVDQLLTVGQMEAGSMVVNRHELEMLPMVEYAADQLAATAEQKQQTLLTDFALKLPTIFGDRDKLQAALVNLVGNAVKYTPEGGEIIVRCGVSDNWVRIDVQDNGPGIPEDEHAKVFEKFYRASNAVDTDHRGNGLGLAFTREVVRMHGGDIELESRLGEGSTFIMRLPVGGQSRSGI